MKNVMNFGEYEAVINFDPDIEMFRGEFVNLTGSADFYAINLGDLRREGELSLTRILGLC